MFTSMTFMEPTCPLEHLPRSHHYNSCYKNSVCLGIDADSKEMSLSVPLFRVQELLQELSLWSQRSRHTKKQLQSLLGKLSFVTARVKPGRIFMARLLNNLRSFSKSRSSCPISDDMRADISWWSGFLLLFNGG